MSNIIDKIQVSGVTYDIGGSGGGKAIEAGRGISVTTGETADTISVSLPIWTNTANNSVKECDSRNNANFYYSHAEGIQTEARYGAHSEGASTKALGYYSHSEGLGTIANNMSEHASGQYNVSTTGSTDADNTLFSVGNGTATNARHNAFEIRQNGDIYLSSGGTDIKLQDHLGGGGGGSSYTAGDGIDITNDVISVTGKVDTTTYNTYTAATDTALSNKQTTLTAGTGINITDNVISATGGNPTVELTQAEYDAIVTAGTVSADTYYIITDAQGGDLSNYWTTAQTQSAINQATSGLQETLVSGTNIKTINNQSLLGSGNIDIQGGGGGKAVSGGTNISITTGATADTINCTLPISAGTNADGKGIIVGDSECSASGNYGIAIGHNADASGGYSFAMGSNSNTSSSHSLAFGDGCKTKGEYSVMFGSGSASHSTKSDYQYYFGRSLNFSNHSYEIAFGLNNSTSHSSTTFGDSGNTLFAIGNGYDFSSTHNYHNAIEIRQNGDIYIPNTNDTSVTGDYAYSLYPMVKLQDTITATAANTTALGGLSLVKLTQSEYDALSPNYDSNTLYVIVN